MTQDLPCSSAKLARRDAEVNFPAAGAYRSDVHPRVLGTLLGSLVCAACGAGSTPNTSGATSGAEAPTCQPGGVAARVELTVDGLSDSLIVEGRPMAIVRDGASTRVRVEGPIAFEGTPVQSGMELLVTRAVETDSLAVRPGARLIDVAPEGTGLRATIAFGMGAEGAPRDATVRALLPCDAVGGSLADLAVTPVTVEATHRVRGGQDLTVSATRDSTGGLLVDLAPGGRAPRARVIEQSEGRARVELIFDEGVVRGWIDAGRLEAAREEPELAAIAVGTTAQATTGGCERTEHDYQYRGGGRVLGGTEVVAGDGARVWGRFVGDTEVIVGVRQADPNGLVEVLQVRGIRSRSCGDLQYDLALVPRLAVTLLPEVRSLD